MSICRWQNAMLRNGKTILHVSVPRPKRAQSQGVLARSLQSLSDLLVHLAISQSAWCPWNKIQHKNHRPRCPMYQSRQHDISVFRSFFCLPSRYCRNNLLVRPIQQSCSEQVHTLSICHRQSAILRNGKASRHVSVPWPKTT